MPRIGITMAGSSFAPTDPVIQRMRELAEEASARAYAPYSRFPVGAAVLSENGEAFAGSNVENASYSLTVCAERNAVFQAISRGHRKILAVVVFTPTARPSPPCGACRQVLSEFGPDAEFFGFSAGGEHLQANLRALLPCPFSLQDSP